MLAKKIGRAELDKVGSETKGKLNIDEQRGLKAAEREMKHNEMFEQWQKKAGLQEEPDEEKKVEVDNIEPE